MPQIWHFLYQNKNFLEQIAHFFRFPKPNLKNDPKSSDKRCN